MTAHFNSMKATPVTINVSGKAVTVPAIVINDRTVIATGKWLKIASIRSEDWLECEAVADPESFITRLKEASLKADILTFAQRLPDTQPKFNYPIEWENVAAIPTASFADWWERRLPQESRKNVRRAAKRGVLVRLAEFDDKLVSGISGIYNETPVRQGRPFWHYGKDVAAVKKENSSFLERSDFIGAYYQDQLVGFIKLVYMGKLASVLQIISMNSHYDKRPANALIAKAVELSEQKGMAYLIYGKFVYGRNHRSPLTEFKRRNGFEKILLPRYYVPLTTRGRIALRLRLHQGVKERLPEPLILFLINLRARIYEARSRRRALD